MIVSRRRKSTYRIMTSVFGQEDKPILNQELTNITKLNRYDLLKELKRYLNNTFIFEGIDIDAYLIDSIRAYFQQTYDLKGLLLVVLLAKKSNLFSEYFIEHINTFLKSQYRGNNLFGYRNPFIDFKRTDKNYIIYCSRYFNLINKIIKEKQRL